MKLLDYIGYIDLFCYENGKRKIYFSFKDFCDENIFNIKKQQTSDINIYEKNSNRRYFRTFDVQLGVIHYNKKIIPAIYVNSIDELYEYF